MIPPVIRKLDENVVNKIAAGEVIQRPASALKEMLENSLDAGSTQVSILVKEGGNKLLQIVDNGSGIRKEDLSILCHRHTTSKLREYADLETISTLGFRGEALCSISFVSHMTVTTMARGAQYGYRVTYKDSEMEAPGPRPVAAVPGTTITVEDLFYNVPTRRKALKSANEEYGLILDVVGRYAVYSTGVAFSCRRQGDARPDISTTAAGSRVDAVRSVYGADVARELIPLKEAIGGGTGPEVPVDGPMGLRIEGLISGANYSTGKKTVLVLFINGRCVECSPLRRALEGLYGTLLPKASRPWIFLDLRLPPRQVEVNMHPTKREVGFMHQAEVIEEIRQAVEAKLLASNESRTFAASANLQTQLPFASLPLAQRQWMPGSGRSDVADDDDGIAMVAGDGQEAGDDGDQDGDEEGEEESEDKASRRKERRKTTTAAAPIRAPGSSEMERKRQASGAVPLPYRPEKLVRVDYRAGTLDAFLIPKDAKDVRSTSVEDAARAAATAGNVARKRSTAVRVAGVGPLDRVAEGSGDQRQSRAARTLPPGLVTAEVLGVGPYVGVLDKAQGEARDKGRSGDADGETRVPPRRGPPPLVTADPAVLELWAEVEGGSHAGLGELLREHTFVGVADGSLVLLQHGTRLYLMDVGTLSRDMFYQLALRRWEQPLSLSLEPPPLVSELVALGLQLLKIKGEWQPEDGSPEELGELVTELLQQNGAMLEKQLGLVVDQQGRLQSVPLLLEGCLPDPARLPDLVVALAKDVDWDHPRERVQSIAMVLADLYAARPPLLPDCEPKCAKDNVGHTEPAGSKSAYIVGDCVEEAGDDQRYPAGSHRHGRLELGTVGQASKNELQGGVDCMSDVKEKAVYSPSVPSGSGGVGTYEGADLVERRERDSSRQPTGDQLDAMAEADTSAATMVPSADANELKDERERALAAYEYKLKQVILPAMRGCLKPPCARATDGSCVQVAALERLYRIFERC
ncbi:hypothetical protein Vafri_6861 [Volvox africanus]|uniref:DNA mismatch repair protein S5 domain-containing protein n=2 Tax=Volvox africanus TaxID=51714 RepID=A0A8J4EWJ2_9CHLO|nr:hypothetical protein Vafri_6861 [Volvox africanus]